MPIWGGLTTKGIPTNEVISIQVLHALRIFDHFIKTVVHLCTEVFNWPEPPTITHKEYLNTAKKNTINNPWRKRLTMGLDWSNK